MATTYSDLLYTAINNSLRGTSALQNPSVDAIGIADTLFDEVAQAVSAAAAADEYRRSLLRRTKSLTFVAGTATLTDDVFTDFIADAVLLAFWLWLGFFATTQLGMVMWEGKPVKLYIINTLHHLVSLVVMSAILAVWPY